MDRQVGQLSVVSYCSELASGELQDIEFSKSCRKILNFPNLAGRILNFPNVAGKILNFPNLVCKIWNFVNLACLWDISKPVIEAFIEQTNLYHPTIKVTAEISDNETVFLGHGCIQRHKIQGKIYP